MLHVTIECYHGEFMYWDGMLYMLLVTVYVMNTDVISIFLSLS